MNETEVISYLRQKAKALSDAADALEGSMAPTQKSSSSPPLNVPGSPPRRRRPSLEGSHQRLTLKSLQNYLRHKKGRVGDLAKHFQASESEIEHLIDTQGSGIVSAKQGWLSYSPLEDENYGLG